MTSTGPAPGERRRGDAPGIGGRSGKTVVRDRAGNQVLWRIFRSDGQGGRFGIGQIVVGGHAVGFPFIGATAGPRIEGTLSRRKITARTFPVRFSIGDAFVPENFMRFGGG